MYFIYQLVLSLTCVLCVAIIQKHHPHSMSSPPITHLPLMPHICVGALGQQWFRQWRVVCSAPSHYLNQCSLVDFTPRNKLQWNLNRNSIISIHENAFENVVCQNGDYFVQGEMSLTILCKTNIYFRNVAAVTLSWWTSFTRISQMHDIVCHLLIPSISISPWNPIDVRLLSVQHMRTNAVEVAFILVKTCNTTGNCQGESGLKTH